MTQVNNLLSIDIRQLFEHESSTYTYLLIDQDTKDAVLIDPVLETVKRDIKYIQDLQLNLLYTLETHVHADHVTSSKLIKEKLNSKIVVPFGSNVNCADIYLKDQEELTFGSSSIKAIATPGHTDAHHAYLIGGAVFTGDALLINGCGRTDFQSGSAKILYHTIKEKIFTLPDHTIVYPAHDYNGFSHSTVGEEKLLNPRLANKSEEEFVHIMDNLNLAYPKKIDIAVPKNLNCGQ